MVKFSVYVQIFCLCFFYQASHASPPQEDLIITYTTRMFCAMLGAGSESLEANELVDAISNLQEYGEKLKELHDASSTRNTFIYADNRCAQFSNFQLSQGFKGKLTKRMCMLRAEDFTESEKSILCSIVTYFNQAILREVSADKWKEIKLPELLFVDSPEGKARSDIETSILSEIGGTI